MKQNKGRKGVDFNSIQHYDRVTIKSRVERGLILTVYNDTTCYQTNIMKIGRKELN